MSIVELIGFFISFLALIFLFFKNQTGVLQKNPDDEIDLVEDDPLREFLKTLESKNQTSPPPLPVKKTPKPIVKEKPISIQTKRSKGHSLSQLEGRRLKSQIESRQLQSQIQERKLKSHLEERQLKTDLMDRYKE